MITKTDLETLNEYRTGTGRVLSVYLDVDQSNAANLNRGFEGAFESKIKAAEGTFEEENEQQDFDGCVAEVRKALAAYEPHARGLVIFARSTGSIWFRELSVPVTTEIYWGPAGRVQRFLEGLDEFQTYGVVLADHSQSRIFTVKLGTIEKHAEVHAMRDIRHIKTAGTDHLYSQPRLQRKADEHQLSYLKRVVELLEHVSKFNPFERLVLAGTTEVVSELFRLLPKPMRARVVASAVLPSAAPERQILEEVLSIGRKAERRIEVERAEALITASAKGRKAVTTLADSLVALNEKRVRELVYSEGFVVRGGVCEACYAVFPNDIMNCGFCGLPVKPVDDLIEAAIGKALAEGATIEQLRGEAAETLKAAGGIGAFLRY